MEKPAYKDVLEEINGDIKAAENANSFEQSSALSQIAIAKSLMAIYSVINQVLQIAKEQQ